VITKRSKITRILQVPIYTANDFALYPISRNSNHSTSEALKSGGAQETYLLGLIKSHLYSAPFYFGYDEKYNVTMRLQQQIQEKQQDENEKEKKPLWETSDDRFFLEQTFTQEIDHCK